MPQILHKTKGIVLRPIKYGETSLIITIFTELFGSQAYLVNGARGSSKKGGTPGNLFQPAAILDLVVYHNELRNIQRIKEFKWFYLYHHIFSDIKKNGVAIFMVELLNKCLKQPEANEELFLFAEDCFLGLDESTETVMANIPLFFMLHLAVFFGFRIDDRYSEENSFLDLQEGTFLPERPTHPYFLEGRQAAITSELLRVRQLEELKQVKLSHDFRRNLLFSYEQYYRLHIQDFGALKSLPVLKDILG